MSDENGNGKEHGMWLPPRLMCLFEDQTLNTSEVMLLGKINSLSRQTEGCFASNRWLAQWWGKTPNHVSASIHKFRDLGLITVKQTSGGKRVIQITFNGEDPKRKIVTGLTKNRNTSNGKSLGQLTSISEYDKIDCNRGAMHPVGSALFPDGKATDRPSRLVQMFVGLSVTQRWHVGRRGSTKTGWTKHTIQSWEKACRDLVDQLGGEWRRVRRVLKWYTAHCQDEYVPRCKTMKSFCERFSDLEEAIRRANKGEVPTEDEYSPTIEGI